MTSQQNRQRKPDNELTSFHCAIVAWVTTVLGLCCVPFSFLAVIFGIMALVKPKVPGQALMIRLVAEVSILISAAWGMLYAGLLCIGLYYDVPLFEEDFHDDVQLRRKSRACEVCESQGRRTGRDDQTLAATGSPGCLPHECRKHKISLRMFTRIPGNGSYRCATPVDEQPGLPLGCFSGEIGLISELFHFGTVP